MARQQIDESDVTVAGILTRLDERTKYMAEDIDSLKHVILEGNGAPPLTVQVAVLAEHDKSQDRRLDDIASEKGRSKGDRMVIWAAVVGGLINMVEMVLRHSHVI